MQFRPLLVAGVAGGVGTSTWVRIVRVATALPVDDLGTYRADQPGRLVDILVTSNTAAATSRIGPALGCCPRPPLLVVMHTAPGVIAESRSYLRMADPHLTARFDIGHRRSWLEMTSAPGERLPAKATDIETAMTQLAPALQAMFAAPHPGAVTGALTAGSSPRLPSPVSGAAHVRAGPARSWPGSGGSAGEGRQRR